MADESRAKPEQKNQGAPSAHSLPTHTPGPWERVTRRNSHAIRPFISTINDQRIATLDGDIDADETHSNARLIAAAPTLADALARLIESRPACLGWGACVLPGDDDGQGTDDPAACPICTARAALHTAGRLP